MLVAELQHPPAVPLRHEIERVVRGVLEPGLLDVRVEVARIDEARTAFVGLLGDRADDRLHPDLRLDRHDLIRLDVRAEADGEVGEAIELLRVHARQLNHAALASVRPTR